MECEYEELIIEEVPTPMQLGETEYGDAVIEWYLERQVVGMICHYHEDHNRDCSKCGLKGEGH